ncbi:hypothetical protein BJ684DRAFT_18168 [Piptocephalis cylindrospora]|uniref:Methyltransferase type 11 domain-containing protein n=1 Tax=Piptocephalis cylindrospora TaxID=1907219 RepID=A0A4P9YBK0_9FUNG|nr:hypothetical protein BJ684DRAFT_18168 [Piptocephalis cylindrospora]|eukprot:RKP15500.1 hypothetical protein BJ684DRAFT_18168 [Piptocephalis cylindrospora]
MGATPSHPAEWSIPDSSFKNQAARESRANIAGTQAPTPPISSSGSNLPPGNRHRARVGMSPSASPTSYFPEPQLSPRVDNLPETDFPYAPGYTPLLTSNHPSKTSSANSSSPSVYPVIRGKPSSSSTKSRSSTSISSSSFSNSSEINLAEFLRMEERAGAGRVDQDKIPIDHTAPLPITPTPSKSSGSNVTPSEPKSEDSHPSHTSRAGFGKRASLNGLSGLRGVIGGGTQSTETLQKIRITRGGWQRNRSKTRVREKMDMDDEMALLHAQTERAARGIDHDDDMDTLNAATEAHKEKEDALSAMQNQAFRSFSEASRLLMEKQGSRMLTLGKAPVISEEEKARLAEESASSLHLALWYVMQRSHLVPLPFNTGPLKVLDVNPGTSKWAEFFAHEHPLATIVVLGNGGATGDAYQGLSCTTNIQHYPNCSPVQWPLPGPTATFDLIRQTCLGSSINISAWVPCLTDLYRMTQPGGWTEVVEMDGKAYSCGNSGEEITKWIASILNQSGISLSVSDDIPLMMQGIGYMDIHIREFALPLGSWGGAVGREVGKFMKAWMSHLRTQAPPECEVPEMVWTRWMRRMLEESGKGNGYLRCTVIVGRRPPYDIS